MELYENEIKTDKNFTTEGASWWNLHAGWIAQKKLQIQRTDLYMSLSTASRFCNRLKSSCFVVHTISSWAISGTTRNVLQPTIFFDFKISPNIWSPMYRTSLPVAPISSEKTSQEPEAKRQGKKNDLHCTYYDYHSICGKLKLIALNKIRSQEVMIIQVVRCI